MEFSLFYFASDAGGASPVSGARYELLVEGARFADANGLCAVWMPERHFSAFGGLYPNPAITAAALSLVTDRVQLRAGSVVAPLHHPVRIAEDWATIDALSNGRVAISFAPGWAPDDFALAPAAYESRKQVMLDHLDVVRRLWRGETIEMENGAREHASICIRPQPTQSELPVWLTTSGRGRHTETSELAGSLGFNLLTNFVGQRFDDIKARAEAYRASRLVHGHPGTGTFTLALHTYISDEVGPDDAEIVDPLVRYLGESFDLAIAQAGADQTARSREGDRQARERLVAAAARRYMEQAALIGSVEHCVDVVRDAADAGVTEVACFIDFGISNERVLAALPGIAAVARACRDM